MSEIGREMDEAVARAIGARIDGDIITLPEPVRQLVALCSGYVVREWHPSRSDNDAMEALRIVLANHPTWRCRLEEYAVDLWAVEFYIHTGYMRKHRLRCDTGFTLAEAICRAIITLS